MVKHVDVVGILSPSGNTIEISKISLLRLSELPKEATLSFDYDINITDNEDIPYKAS